MGELLVFLEKPVRVKGLNQNALPNEKVLEYLFREEVERVDLLPSLPSSFTLPSHPTLLYPGCGADILYLLLVVERLFPAPDQEITLQLVDLDDNVGVIKTVLDEVGVSFAETERGLDFYWNGKLIHLHFQQGNIFTLLPSLPSFDIYFERAFRIMKEQDPTYEQQVFEKLNPGGLLISDSGFQQVPLQRLPVDQRLSAYGEMVVGVKPVHPTF